MITKGFLQLNSVACASYFLVCIHFACNFGETILGGAYNATKIKIFKSLIKKRKLC